jgi:hypothetical protein
LISYRVDLRRIAEHPTPLAFGDGVALVDGQLSAQVDGIMVGLFPDLKYAYP